MGLSREGFERELSRVLDAAFGYASRLCQGDREAAADIVQEASVSAYRGRDGFEPGTSFKSWFFKIVTNQFYRRAGRRQVETVSADEGPASYLYDQAVASGFSGEEDPASVLQSKLDAATVRRAIDALADEYRSVSAMYFVSEMSYEEIALTLEIPVGTVRSRLHRARRLLQAALWELASSRGWAVDGGTAEVARG